MREAVLLLWTLLWRVRNKRMAVLKWKRWCLGNLFFLQEMRHVRDKGLETSNTKLDTVWIFFHKQWTTLFRGNTQWRGDPFTVWKRNHEGSCFWNGALFQNHRCPLALSGKSVAVGLWPEHPGVRLFLRLWTVRSNRVWPGRRKGKMTSRCLRQWQSATLEKSRALDVKLNNEVAVCIYFSTVCFHLSSSPSLKKKKSLTTLWCEKLLF